MTPHEQYHESDSCAETNYESERYCYLVKYYFFCEWHCYPQKKWPSANKNNIFHIENPSSGVFVGASLLIGHAYHGILSPYRKLAPYEHLLVFLRYLYFVFEIVDF
jgi:hypothetical protein